MRLTNAQKEVVKIHLGEKKEMFSGFYVRLLEGRLKELDFEFYEELQELIKKTKKI